MKIVYNVKIVYNAKIVIFVKIVKIVINVLDYNLNNIIIIINNIQKKILWIYFSDVKLLLIFVMEDSFNYKCENVEKTVSEVIILLRVIVVFTVPLFYIVSNATIPKILFFVKIASIVSIVLIVKD